MCTQPDRAPTFRQRAASQAGPAHETAEGHGSTGPLPAPEIYVGMDNPELWQTFAREQEAGNVGFPVFPQTTVV